MAAEMGLANTAKATAVLDVIKKFFVVWEPAETVSVATATAPER